MDYGNISRALPDLPEIQASGFGLSEALALWCEFQNTPGMTPVFAREVLEQRKAETKRGRRSLN